MAVAQNAVLTVPLYSAGKDLALGITANGGEMLDGFRMVYPRDVLLDDRAFI